MSRTDGELYCDDRVVGGLDENGRKAYANVLVLAASRRNTPGVMTLATGMTITGRSLKRRVEGVLGSKKVRKGAALCFLLAAAMCLAGAFATSEVQRHWHIEINVPGDAEWALTAEKLGSLKSDPEALNTYAASLWQSDWFREKDVRGPFTLIEPDRIEDASGKLILQFEADGRLTDLNNGLSGWEDAVWLDGSAEPSPMDSVEDENRLEELDEYLNSFAGAFMPGLMDSADGWYWTRDENYRRGNTYFSVFTLRRFENGGDARPCQVAVECGPELRVVWFHWFGEDEDTSYLGNG